MNAVEKRDPFFSSQYWEDLCKGLKEQAGNAHNECSSDKVEAAYYGSCIKGQLFDSLYHLLLASYNRGDAKEELSAVFIDLFSGMEFCDDAFQKSNHLFSLIAILTCHVDS